MKKKFLSVILVMTILLSNVASSFGAVVASADDGHGVTYLSYSDIIALFNSAFGVDYSNHNYYITTSAIEDYGSMVRRWYSVFFCAPQSDNEVHVINDNYATNQYCNDFKVVCDPNLDSTFFICNFVMTAYPDGSHDTQYGNWFYYSGVNNYPTTQFHLDHPYFHMSNMNVIVNDENINRTDFTLGITYSESQDSVIYSASNLSDDILFHAVYGLRYSTNSRSASFDLPAGVSKNASLSLQEVRDFATYYNCDSMEVEAYITLYEGIEVIGSESIAILDLLDDSSGDEYFGEYEEYEDMPDPSDYFDDPPDFPTLDPVPDFPGFDPDHPWQSLFDILEWLGDCIKTPFVNLWRILTWVVSTIVYYISNGFRFLRDCFTVIVHNLQHLIHNLCVKLRILFTDLFVPNIAEMRDKILDIPIIAQVRGAFNAASLGNHTISITLLDNPCTLSAVTSLGESGCSILYNLSTVAIYATAAFGLFNLILSIFGIHLKSGGD